MTGAALLFLVPTQALVASAASGPSGSSLTIGHIHIMPYGNGGHAWAPAGASTSSGILTAAPVGSQLSYYGGPVMTQGKFYTIFWQPAGWHFEAAFNGAGPTPADTRYENTINQFFQALGGSSYYNILTQYSNAPSIGGGTSPGPTIQNVASLAGTTVDTNAFPTGSTFPCAGATPQATISDDQLQTEIKNVVAAQGWTVDNNSEFFVYTPVGLYSFMPGSPPSCSGVAGGFCAYHGTFGTGNDGSTYLYSNMWDTNDAPGCGATASGASGDNAVEQEIGVTSHEMSETVTDPYVGLATTFAAPLGWYDFDTAHGINAEIGDLCNGQDAVVTLGGSTYNVQTEFSNADNNCVSTFAGGSTGPGGGTATPELGSGELFATGVLPLLGMMFYRRRRSRRTRQDDTQA